MAQTTIKPYSPEAAILQLHRYLWTPARYAHPRWLSMLGFNRGQRWSYGENPPLDRCLNRALQARRGTPRLPAQLNDHQRRIVHLVPNIERFALAIGLLVFECNDYFLLPDYRREILRWLDDALIWQLFGLCRGRKKALFSPRKMIDHARKLGVAVLSRAALNDPVLYAVLITLAPCERALWPSVPILAMNLLERSLCEYRGLNLTGSSPMSELFPLSD